MLTTNPSMQTADVHAAVHHQQYIQQVYSRYSRGWDRQGPILDSRTRNTQTHICVCVSRARDTPCARAPCAARSAAHGAVRRSAARVVYIYVLLVLLPCWLRGHPLPCCTAAAALMLMTSSTTSSSHTDADIAHWCPGHADHQP